MMVLLTQADGTSLVIEIVWENRFMHVDELNRMGANIKIDGHSALIKPSKLTGAEVTATDLRAGAAPHSGRACSQRGYRDQDIYHIERGHEDIAAKLSSIGAKIRKVK